MSTPSSPSGQVAARRAVRLLAPVTALGLVLSATPAFADVAVGWSELESVSGIQWLIVLVAAPVALSLLISALVLLPGLARGEGLLGRDEHADDEWIGGPRGGAGELESRDSEPAGAQGGAGGSF